MKVPHLLHHVSMKEQIPLARESFLQFRRTVSGLLVAGHHNINCYSDNGEGVFDHATTGLRRGYIHLQRNLIGNPQKQQPATGVNIVFHSFPYNGSRDSGRAFLPFGTVYQAARSALLITRENGMKELYVQALNS